MKYLICIPIFLLFLSGTAQTRTEKYNTYLERYEYFDSEGELVGYKKYNQWLEQWEYTEVDSKESRYRDFGEYKKPINTNLVRQVMAEKQRSLDNNEAAVNATLKEIGLKIQNYYNGSPNSTQAKNYFITFFSQRIASYEASDGKLYFGNNHVAEEVINSLEEAYLSTLKNIPFYPEEKSKEELAIEYYNVGVKNYEQGNITDAIENYKTAIKLDPSLSKAYQNLSFSLLARDRVILNEMNSLGGSKADNQKYSHLVQKRKELLNGVKPYLEKLLELQPASEEAKTTLNNVNEHLRRLNFTYEDLVEENSSKKESKYLNQKFISRATLLYSMNSQDEWVLDKEVNNITRINLYHDMYYIKEGDGEWKANNWQFERFDKEKNMYVYSTSKGQTIGIDSNFDYIVWYSQRDKNGRFSKLKGLKIEKVD